MHKTLTNWTAKRAGGRITVYGTDKATGEEAKLVGIDKISLDSDCHNAVFATDKDGEVHILKI